MCGGATAEPIIVRTQIGPRVKRTIFDLDQRSSKSINFFKKGDRICVSVRVRNFEDAQNSAWLVFWILVYLAEHLTLTGSRKSFAQQVTASRYRLAAGCEAWLCHAV
jgi:hypothetical protein